MQFLAKTKMEWFEPWFFVQSQRSLLEWLRALATPLSVCGFGTAFLLFVGFEWWKVVPASLFIMSLQIFQCESIHFRRRVWIDDEKITAYGRGDGYSVTTCRLDAIQMAEIIPSTPNRVAKLTISVSGELLQVGLPRSVDLPTLAQLLCNLGVLVHMHGWNPVIDQEWIADEQEYRTPLPHPGEVAWVKSIPEQQQNLTPWSTQRIGEFTANLSFWLLGAAALGIVTGYVWQFISNAGSISTTAIAAGLLLFILLPSIAIQAHLRGLVGLANLYIRKVAQTQVLARAESVIRDFDERVYFVDVLDPANCHDYHAKQIDFGFISTDVRKSRINFEGNNQRWSIPFSAILRCNVGQVETGTKTQVGPIRCFVELEFDSTEGPLSVALRIPNLYVGNYTDDLRLEHAVRLHTELTTHLPVEPMPRWQQV